MRILTVEVSASMAFNVGGRRHLLANYIAAIMKADSTINSNTPYREQAGDDTRWVLDGQNDWYLVFCRDNDRHFHIQHRYNDEFAVEAITRWVAYRYGGPGNTVVEKFT